MTCVGQALEHAPSGQTVNWTGNNGPYLVKPLNAFQNSGGLYCREYTATETVGSQARNVTSSACRRADGSWHKVS